MLEIKEYENLEQLVSQNRVFYHFAELCRIPHPSFKEKRISDYLLGWARERGLYAFQDESRNVFIRKPAFSGYEEAPAVMLQAHMDMVCEKAPDTEHDFDTDPIRIQLDGDLLSTGGRTTLGADDGIGVALAMAVLELEDLPHPPLEALFTTAEEEDLSGAQNVDASDFRARLLVNIDNAVEHELLAGSCGGMGVELTLPAETGPVPAGWTAYSVAISGLPGGHSGEDIHRGHGNANILLGRLLYACQKSFPLRIGALAGGNFRLAIPREARAVVYIPAENKAEFHAIIKQEEEKLWKEYEALAPDFAVHIEEAGKENGAVGAASSPTAAKRLVQALYLSPNGISDMNNAVQGVVESSDNLGELSLDITKDQFMLVFEIRASFGSTRDYLHEKIQSLAELLGGTCRGFAEYPGWSFNPDSRLRKIATEIYRKEFGEEIVTKVVHAGLECGCFMPKMPGLDAISIGPDAWGLHSPGERLSVASTERVYWFLKKLLEEIKA